LARRAPNDLGGQFRERRIDVPAHPPMMTDIV
jgi:hypothetical protein